jgi:hypothetical protein
VGLLAAIALSGSVFMRAVAGTSCDYQDLMPAYENFAAATSGVPPEERAAEFLTQITEHYPDYYAKEVFGDEAKITTRSAQFFASAQSAAIFQDVPPLNLQRLSELAKVVGPQFAMEQSRFMQTFPDFTCDTAVEFGVSLLMFDGHPAQFAGKQHLLFGVDTIALLHVPSDMAAFFDHELFHLYHRQIVGSRAPPGEDPAWWTMWREGLATYVSQRMNPTLDAQQVLWYPHDLVARMQKDLAHAAQLMLKDIDTRGSGADRWFIANQVVEDLPSRAGYYLGYLFAKSEGDAQALPKLARMSPDQVHADAVKFLRRLGHVPR